MDATSGWPQLMIERGMRPRPEALAGCRPFRLRSLLGGGRRHEGAGPLGRELMVNDHQTEWFQRGGAPRLNKYGNAQQIPSKIEGTNLNQAGSTRARLKERSRNGGGEENETLAGFRVRAMQVLRGPTAKQMDVDLDIQVREQRSGNRGRHLVPKRPRSPTGRRNPRPSSGTTMRSTRLSATATKASIPVIAFNIDHSQGAKGTVFPAGLSSVRIFPQPAI